MGGEGVQGELRAEFGGSICFQSMLPGKISVAAYQGGDSDLFAKQEEAKALAGQVSL